MRSALPLAALIAVCLSSWGAQAQAPPAPDPQRGATLAAQGNQNGAVPCAQCHGPAGEGNAQGPFPRLTGQSAAYLLKQLQNYTDGSRPNDIMTPIAQALSEQERQDAAAYYAGLKASLPAPTQPNPDLDKRGRALALVGVDAVGNAAVGIQACENCHGPDGIGEAPLYPALAGQWGSYAASQLSAFKEGTRHNDLDGVMREIAARLTPEDIDALSRYYENIRPHEAAR